MTVETLDARTNPPPTPTPYLCWDARPGPAALPMYMHICTTSPSPAYLYAPPPPALPPSGLPPLFSFQFHSLLMHAGHASSTPVAPTPCPAPGPPFDLAVIASAQSQRLGPPPPPLADPFSSPHSHLCSLPHSQLRSLPPSILSPPLLSIPPRLSYACRPPPLQPPLSPSQLTHLVDRAPPHENEHRQLLSPHTHTTEAPPAGWPDGRHGRRGIRQEAWQAGRQTAVSTLCIVCTR